VNQQRECRSHAAQVSACFNDVADHHASQDGQQQWPRRMPAQHAEQPLPGDLPQFA
jgi:hypothetical protein